MKFVASYADEAELGAPFMNAKVGRIIQLTLEELGHTQPPIPIHLDKATSASTANDTVKRQQSLSMEMQKFYIRDQVEKGEFDVVWHPGKENLRYYA